MSFFQSSLTKAAITATCAIIKAPTHLTISTLSSSRSVLEASGAMSFLVANSLCDFFRTAITVSDCCRVKPLVSSSLTN